MNARSSHWLADKSANAFLALWAWLTMIFLVAPLAVVVPISFSGGAYLQFPPKSYSLQWYRAYFNDSTWIDATFLSFRIGVVATVLTLLLACPFALGITRGLKRWGSALERLSMAPMIVPTIVYSVSVYSLFTDLGLVGNWFGIAVAHTVYCFPFAVVVLSAGLRNFDLNQEQAAMGLGASRLTAIRKVTLPQIKSSFISAAFLCFIMSFDELVISMFLSGVFGTLPKKMFDNIRLSIDPTIAAVSVIEIVIVIAVMAVLLRMNKRLQM